MRGTFWRLVVALILVGVVVTANVLAARHKLSVLRAPEDEGLSPFVQQALSAVDEPIHVTCFLPAEGPFYSRKLFSMTRALLEEFRSAASNLSVQYADPALHADVLKMAAARTDLAEGQLAGGVLFEGPEAALVVPQQEIGRASCRERV